MKRKWESFGIITTACWLLMASCSTTTLNAVWKDPNYPGGKLKKVFVIGVSKNQVIRRLFEDEFVSKLKAQQTDAVASYRLIPSEDKLDKDTVESKIKDLGIDAVLVTRLVNTKKERVSSPSPQHYKDWYGWYSRGYGYAAAPGYITEYEIAVLETEVFDTKTGKLIWSALSDTVTGGSNEVEIKSLIDVITKSLSKNRLIN